MWKALRSGYGQAERSQAQRLKAVVAEHKIKVPLHCFLPVVETCASQTKGCAPPPLASSWWPSPPRHCTAGHLEMHAPHSQRHHQVSGDEEVVAALSGMAALHA